MKKIILFCLLFSCNSKQIKKVVSFYENGQPQIIEYSNIIWSDTVLIKKQELFKNGNIKFQTEFDQDYSKCSSYLESGELIEQKFFYDNHLDSIIGYDINGKKTIHYNLDY